MPATSGTLEYAKTAVDDATQLTGVDATAMEDGSLAFLRVTGKFYHLVRGSTASPDGTSVILTKSGVGRWLVGPSANDVAIAVPTEADLSLVAAAQLLDGQFAWIGDPSGGLGRAQGSTWQLVTQLAGLPALAAHLVIASTVAGRVWQRQVNLVNQRWVQSTTWVLDGSAGDDQNDGQTNTSPLRTGAELARRMAKQQVGGVTPIVAVTVTLLSSIADALDFRGVTALGGINVVATEPTQAGVGATGALTSATAISRAVAPFFQQIAAAGVDFAPFIATKSKIILTSGPNAGAYAWFESGAGGVGVAAQTSPFVLTPTTGTATIISPAGTETYKIVSQLGCTSVQTDTSGLTISSGGGLTLTIGGMRPTAQGTAQRGGVAIWIGSDLSATSFQPRGQNTLLNGCKVAFVAGGGGNGSITFNATLCIGAIVGTLAWNYQIQTDTLISDQTIFVGFGRINLNAVGWHNTTAAKHAIDCSGQPSMGQVQLGSAAQAGALYGSLAGAGSIGFNLSKFNFVDGGGVVPTLTTTGANVSFGSATKTWAQLPFSDFVVGAPGAANNSAWL